MLIHLFHIYIFIDYLFRYIEAIIIQIKYAGQAKYVDFRRIYNENPPDMILVTFILYQAASICFTQENIITHQLVSKELTYNNAVS